ncbi:MAG: ABC transporter permease, partial [Thermodesulfobacteriota bacterium]
MAGFLFSRLLTGIAVIFIVASATFFLLRVLPGGPFDNEKKIPPQILKNIEKKYGLDKPIIKQYAIYIGSLAKGDFGPSYRYIDRSANDIIRETLPVSLELGVIALLAAVFFGIIAGVLSASMPRTIYDISSVIFSTSLISVPSFVIGAALIYFFSVKWRIFPAALWGSPEHIILPALTLSLAPFAYISRLVRSNMLDISGELYIRTAKAKGISRIRILTKHILRNALIPVVTVLGPITAYLVTGSFVVEHIFAIPGIGRFFVFAVSNRDYS